MTLTKRKIIREVGRRTRQRNRDVEQMLETLIDVLGEAIQAGERIEIEHFLVLEVLTLTRRQHSGAPQRPATVYRTLHVRPGRRLRTKLREQPRDP
jgi:nucleoid DNA-binding protein